MKIFITVSKMPITLYLYYGDPNAHFLDNVVWMSVKTKLKSTNLVDVREGWDIINQKFTKMNETQHYKNAKQVEIKIKFKKNNYKMWTLADFQNQLATGTLTM